MRLREILRDDLTRSYRLERTDRPEPRGIRLWARAFRLRFVPVLLIRLAHASYKTRIRFLAKLFSMLNFRWFGIEVGLACKIGPGLYLPHTVGTVIGAAEIGANAMIYQGVTLGAKDLDIPYTPELRPRLGDNVTIGAGAKVLGGVTLGHFATVGANAVVTKDVAPGQTVGGIPARPIRTQSKFESERTLSAN